MATRNKVSERDYIDVNGAVVDRMEQATGAKYTLGQMQGETFKPVKSWTLQFGEAGVDTTMYGVLGFHTKLGNVANTVLNDKDAPGSIDQAAAAITEFTAGTSEGEWAERAGGGGGLRYDPNLVSQAIALAKNESDPAPYLAKCQGRVNQKGESVSQDAKGEWPKGAISYAAFAMRNAAVRGHYEKLAGTGIELSQL